MQTGRSNVSTFTIPKDELYEWADQVLAPTAELAFNGDGEYRCGEWRQFCKAKADCRERANANMEFAKFEFRQPPLLTDEEVEEILGRIWPEEIVVLPRVVDVNITRLRSKIGPYGKHIVTRSGYGYGFED